MKKIYEVTGRYPATRPVKIGSKIEIGEDEARYFVLDGALKPVREEPPAQEDERRPSGRKPDRASRLAARHAGAPAAREAED